MTLQTGNGAGFAPDKVVTCDVPSPAIVGGLPARLWRQRFPPERVAAPEDSRG
ncbi:hypothetical protein LAZ40_06285 [Cereibacter sphaeroides]|uniref:hypothetical protein n=1 Tax=Cereibacter sphaeroides TaxID=1063 RepID=UPI001F32CE87|nr:hypothetical protein [Cereibacter sphaeroides]MCE6958655.1 hypothetical protein [Cereibacter sphaeroides]MCE6973462.1 hypothetical protein [Cereibacter sphaeroides]